jgi:elongation factor Ts
MVTLDQIKELRDRTGISTTACKKALEEANGDMDAAIDILRKKGEAKAAERSDRATGEGAVVIVGDDSKKAMVALACETDFVARNDDFRNKAMEMANRVLAEGEGVDFSGEVSDLGISMGEKVELKGVKLLTGTMVGGYVHSNAKIGVLAVLDGGTAEQAFDVALHAAATNPAVTNPDEVDMALLEKERVLWADQLAQEGKPQEIVAKIMEGKEKKFREENALSTQPFVKNPEQTVAEYLGGVKIVTFAQFRV